MPGIDWKENTLRVPNGKLYKRAFLQFAVIWVLNVSRLRSAPSISQFLHIGQALDQPGPYCRSLGLTHCSHDNAHRLPQLGSFDWGKPHRTLPMTGRGLGGSSEASKWARRPTSSAGRLTWVARIRVRSKASGPISRGPGRRSQPRALQHGRGPWARKEVTWEGNEARRARAAAWP